MDCPDATVTALPQCVARVQYTARHGLRLGEAQATGRRFHPDEPREVGVDFGLVFRLGNEQTTVGHEGLDKSVRVLGNLLRLLVASHGDSEGGGGCGEGN